MKQLTIYAGALILMAFVFTGCYKDVILPDAVIDPDGPPQAVSFKTALVPLLNSKCALSGCHVAGDGDHRPFLTPDVSYRQLVNGGFVNIAVPKESILYQMINGEMREYIPSAADRQKIYDWIRTGAEEN